jgi:hypothetical protein
MTQPPSHDNAVLGPLNLQLLYETLLELCVHRNLDPQCLPAQTITRELVVLFDTGVPRSQQLLDGIVIVLDDVTDVAGTMPAPSFSIVIPMVKTVVEDDAVSALSAYLRKLRDDRRPPTE